VVLNTLGALLYRAGRHTEALDRLTEGIAASKGNGTDADWIFLAMVEHRLGHQAEAKSWLGRVGVAGPVSEGRLSWDSLEVELLRHEAEELLNAKMR